MLRVTDFPRMCKFISMFFAINMALHPLSVIAGANTNIANLGSVEMTISKVIDNIITADMGSVQGIVEDDGLLATRAHRNDVDGRFGQFLDARQIAPRVGRQVRFVPHLSNVLLPTGQIFVYRLAFAQHFQIGRKLA